MTVQPDELLKSLATSNAIGELVVEIHCRPTVRPEVVAHMPDEILIIHDRCNAEVINALSNTLEIPFEFMCRRLPPALEEFSVIL